MVEVPVSIGELLDKMSILVVKMENMKSQEKIANCKKEFEYLSEVVEKNNIILGEDYYELKKVNKKLWDIEEGMRKKEAVKTFDEEFIDLTRNEYRLNDLRADIKRKINLREESELLEEKEYEPY